MYRYNVTVLFRDTSSINGLCHLLHDLKGWGQASGMSLSDDTDAFNRDYFLGANYMEVRSSKLLTNQYNDTARSYTIIFISENFQPTGIALSTSLAVLIKRDVFLKI